MRPDRSSTWREDVGIYAALAAFLIAAVSGFTALEVFVAVATFYALLLVLLLFLANTAVWSLVSGAAIQYSMLSALAMPFFAPFQPSFWAFIGLYSLAWWAFLFLVIELARRTSPRGTIDDTGPWALGMIWIIFIPVGGIVRVIWSLVSRD